MGRVNKSGVNWSDPVSVKEYYSRPEVKARKKEYAKEYCSRPEVKARKKEYAKEYFSRPEVKAREKARQKEYISRPGVKAQRAKNRARSPGNIVRSFKEGWNRKWAKEKENKKAMAELFLDTVCEYDLTDKERCGLIEEMLKKETKKEGG